MAKKDFIIQIVSHQAPRAETAQSIELLHQRLGNSFFVKYDTGDAFLDRMRSVAATTFYRKDWADYMILIDDDIVFMPEDVIQLMNDLRNGYELVGGAYSVKDGTQLSSFGLEPHGGILLDGTVREIKWLATGFMGIKKTLLDKMVKELSLPVLHKGQWCECYPFFVFCGDTKMLISEDWDFCEKAKLVGVKPYMDTAIHVGHIGSKVYKVDDVVNATSQRVKDTNRSQGILKPEDAKQALDAVVSVLNDMGVRYWVDSGTLLAGVRNKTFNIFDHDIDIRCFRDDLPDDLMSEFVMRLYDKGYRTFQQNKGDRKQLLCLFSNNVLLDLKFCEHNEEWLWYYVWDNMPGSSAFTEDTVIHCFPLNFFDEFGEIEIDGTMYNCPKNYEGYLLAHYGEKWKEFKAESKDVDMTDIKWDAQYSPPCAIPLYELERRTRQHHPIVEELTKYIGHDITLESSYKSAEYLNRMWHDWKGSNEDFYKNNKEYLFDLARWYNTTAGTVSHRIIKGISGDTLVIGCGLGEDSFHYAETCRYVYGHDINQELIDFCNWRKANKGITNVDFGAEPPVDFSKFDNIIAIHVLEHIENLREYLLDIGSKAKFGSKFFHIDEFVKGKYWDMHFEYSPQDVVKWLWEAGFDPMDKYTSIKVADRRQLAVTQQPSSLKNK